MIKKLLSISLLLIITLQVVSQEDSQDSIKRLMLTLKEAQDYALKHNAEIKNKNLDVEIAQKTVWETTAIGLPQVTLSASMQYMFEVPEMEMMSMGIDFPNAEQGDFITHTHVADTAIWKLGEEFSGNVDITISQLIFSGEYIVGLQASRTYKMISEQAKIKTEQETRKTIAESYYLVLIMEENSRIMDSTYKNMLNTYNQMDQMQKQGFIEKTEIDQLKITLNELDITNKSLKRQAKLTNELLKMQLGLKKHDHLRLTDSLEYFIYEETIPDALIPNFTAEQNIDYQIIENQEEIAKLSLRREQSKYLPTISAFYRHQIQINAPDFNFQPPDVIGVNISLPLFTSLSRHAVTQKASMEYQKIKNTKEQLSTALSIQYEQARNDFLVAFETYHLQKQNLNLARRIYSNKLEKYKNGMTSSLDLNQAQTQMLEIQSKYFQSLVDMLNAKIKIDVLCGM